MLMQIFLLVVLSPATSTAQQTTFQDSLLDRLVGKWVLKGTILWLDNTGNGGLTEAAIGHAAPDGDNIALLFKGGDGSLFHTTFAYDRLTQTWQWGMDGEENGKLQPIARVKLAKTQ